MSRFNAALERLATVLCQTRGDAVGLVGAKQRADVPCNVCRLQAARLQGLGLTLQLLAPPSARTVPPR